MPSSKSMILLALAGAAPLIQAHSWVERLMVIAPNGTYVGEPGFPRGNVPRGPGFGDALMQHLITGGPADTMCRDSQKSTASQVEGSPRLKAPAGAAVAIQYQENGHVSLPDTPKGKAKNRGDVYVYGTSEPKEGELFNDVHGQWTADGKGGDGRGVLLVKASYDDGQCYQINGGAISVERQKEFGHPVTEPFGRDLWCQNDVRLPADAPGSGAYTLYWVWDWATAAGIDPGLPNGKNETYTTCMDIDRLDSPVQESKATEMYSFVEGQPIQHAADPKQFANLGEQQAAGDAQPVASSEAPASPSAPSVTYETSASSPTGAAESATAVTNINPIPASDTSSPTGAAESAPAETNIAPIPATDASPAPQPTASASTQAPSISTPSFVTVTVTDLDSVTVTVTATSQTSSIVPIPAAASGRPGRRIRGRNSIFQPGN